MEFTDAYLRLHAVRMLREVLNISTPKPFISAVSRMGVIEPTQYGYERYTDLSMLSLDHVLKNNMIREHYIIQQEAFIQWIEDGAG